MPINSRYTSGAFKTTSSLFKSAKSAANKMQQIEDSVQAYKWSTNQITNEEYMNYADTRLKGSSDIMDQISWSNKVNSVQKEINSDYRASVILDISRTVGNTSNDDLQKLTMLSNLYQQAAKDGDMDAMVSLETQYNNTLNTYQSKLESEAKAGLRSSINTINETFNVAKNAIDMERIQIKNSPDLDPLAKAAAIADLDARETNANILKFSAAVDSDGNLDQVKAGQIQERIATLQGNLVQNAKFFKGEMIDQNGQPIDINNPLPGQVITDFTPNMTEDVLGRKNFILADGFAKVYENGKAKIVDLNNMQEVILTYDALGNPVYTNSQNTLDMTQYAELQSSDGQPYFAKIQTDEIGKQKFYGGTGEVTDKEMTGDKPPALAYVIDENGEKRTVNTYTSGKDEAGNIVKPDFTAPTPDEAFSQAGGQLATAMGAETKAGATTFKQAVDPQDRLKQQQEIELAKAGVKATVLTRAKESQTAAVEANRLAALATPAVKVAQATFGPSAMVSKVNPFTQKYEQPVNYPAPYRLPTPTATEQRNAANILSPTGFMQDIINPGLSKLQTMINVPGASWGSVAKAYESQYGKIQTGSAEDALLWDKFSPTKRTF